MSTTNPPSDSQREAVTSPTPVHVCPQCGSTKPYGNGLNAKELACPDCGLQYDPHNYVCPNCGGFAPEGYCENCGPYPKEASAVYPPPIDDEDLPAFILRQVEDAERYGIKRVISYLEGHFANRPSYTASQIQTILDGAIIHFLPFNGNENDTAEVARWYR